MEFILASDVRKVRESFTYNPLLRALVNPTLLSLMEIHKEFISNASGLKSDLGEGQHGCVYVTMGDPKYTLHSQIMFSPQGKP